MTDTKYQPLPETQITHPEWSKNATIYQINLRQFTQEGTFTAAAEHLPRLKKLGVDILWLMPIHEIGEEKRKGSLGSPYAVLDYYSINPEFGTLSSFEKFLNEAKQIGFKVILDWVGNHTAWDCVLVKEHPDWYYRNWKGEFRPTPWHDWDDIIELDFRIPAVREYMCEAMKYWVKELDIDGFRCDVAGYVPTDFWNLVRQELDAIKPVFLLAEWENRDLHNKAFDMTYGWQWHDIMHRISSGNATVKELSVYYGQNEKAFPRDAMRMLFVSNHDKNSWVGTEYELFDDALDAVIVLSVISEGMPLIYNGQEAGNQKRLPFFEKDCIDWQPSRYTDFYQQLLALKKQNTALWNGAWGARMQQVFNDSGDKVFSFVRQNQADKVFAVFNFSNQLQNIMLLDGPYQGDYMEVFSNTKVAFGDQAALSIAPWSYRVYVC